MNIESWDKEQIASLIFETGFTTAEKANTLAGRGVGMDLIKRKLEKINGKIYVEFAENRFCEFIVEIPLQDKRKKKSVSKKLSGKVKV